MRRNLLATIALLAIAGLTFMQFRLLVIGARLEKQRFDQQALVAQRNIRNELNAESPLSKALVDHLRLEESERPDPQSLANSMQEFLKEKFAEVGITAQFSFAIVSRQSKEAIEFSSYGLRPEKFSFGEYVIPLGNYFSSQLFKEKILHIDVENLFAYLLLELDYLVVPSVLCLLAILICLAILMSILKKEEKLNRIKNDFINNLTHELKTPAFSIALSNKLATDNLASGNLSKVAEFLKIIEKENNKIKAHTEKVLELASLENSNKQLQMEDTDLHVLIEEIIAGFQPKIEPHGGSIDYFPNAKMAIAKVDPIHFGNLLGNLLDNAMKYNNGQPHIEVTTESSPSHFIFSVKDNGIGISAADQKMVFDKFFRISNNDVHKVKGFGLGLSYVRQIVHAHNGTITLESKLGEGTIFKVGLPI